MLHTLATHSVYEPETKYVKLGAWMAIKLVLDVCMYRTTAQTLEHTMNQTDKDNTLAELIDLALVILWHVGIVMLFVVFTLL